MYFTYEIVISGQLCGEFASLYVAMKS